MTHDPVRVERRGATALLTIDSPATRNAFTPEVRDGLAREIAAIAAAGDVRAVVISGAGGNFCAGGDVRAMAANPDRGNVEWLSRMHALNRFLRDLILLDKPVIAAVDGAAYGGGLALALAADFVVATPRARFCAPFMKLGLVPDCGITYTLPRAVGAQRAGEMMLSAREVLVAEAREIGIVSEIHETDKLLPRALAMAAAFETASPLALSLAKRNIADPGALDRALDNEARAQTLCFATPEHRQAVRRFVEKQPVAFAWPA